LARLLDAELARFPGRAGVYVRHLETREEAGVHADQAFSSASVIKIPIMVLAYQLAEQGNLDLNERVELHRADLRDGTGVLQYHDAGLGPTVRDLITQMIITSDNTATDLMVLKVGGVDRLNRWLVELGYSGTKMIGRGFEYRRKLLAGLNPEFGDLTPEETTGLMYALQDNPLFALYGSLFTGPRLQWVETVRDPANRRRFAQEQNKRTVEDPAYWLGSMKPSETGRMLEAIEHGTIASRESCDAMKLALRRQQAGSRRIPHYLDVPAGHKTGDSRVIANDVGLVYARSGTIVFAFFSNAIDGPYGEAEDRIGRIAQLVVDYFDGPNR
jgi:Beta-lactamase class A